jgi:hypothetical protein
MRGQTGLFDIDERLRELSAKGDELEISSCSAAIWNERYRARSDREAIGRLSIMC